MQLRMSFPNKNGHPDMCMLGLTGVREEVPAGCIDRQRATYAVLYGFAVNLIILECRGSTSLHSPADATVAHWVSAHISQAAAPSTFSSSLGFYPHFYVASASGCRSQKFTMLFGLVILAPS